MHRKRSRGRAFHDRMRAAGPHEPIGGTTVKKLLVLAAAVVGVSIASVAPAGAAGQLCYDVNVEIAGQAPVTQSGCQDLP